MRELFPCVYIVTNKRNGTLYTGVTSNLIQRVWQHRNGTFKGFSAKYGCSQLIWFKMHETMEGQSDARSRSRNGSVHGSCA
jgi:putative endonuclease